MIPRYSRKVMTDVFSDENRFDIWLEIEKYATEKQAKIGVVPQEAADDLNELGDFNVDRILEIEAETKHDVIAFLTNVAEYVGENSRFVHQGMTSSDVLDTCLSVQLSEAASIIQNDLSDLLDALKERAYEHKDTICIGRSHGIHAEPTTFGLKLATFYAEFMRNYQRLNRERLEISQCAISGAVGTFANIDPSVQEYVAGKMGLWSEDISTQVIPRDRHAMFFAVIGVIASSVERLAVEIRHLQRTEVGEVMEYFSKGQKGSSAMPHKRNPILTENLTGLARVVRAGVIPAMENVALWHERDISHSSVERTILPDALIALDFALARLTNVVKNMIVDKGRMERNMEKLCGVTNSQKLLLELTQRGVSREEAYAIIQENAHKTLDSPIIYHIFESLKKDERVMKLFTEDELLQITQSTSYHTKHVDYIFEKVFGNGKKNISGNAT